MLSRHLICRPFPVNLYSIRSKSAFNDHVVGEEPRHQLVVQLPVLFASHRSVLKKYVGNFSKSRRNQEDIHRNRKKIRMLFCTAYKVTCIYKKRVKFSDSLKIPPPLVGTWRQFRIRRAMHDSYEPSSFDPVIHVIIHRASACFCGYLEPRDSTGVLRPLRFAKGRVCST